MPSTKKRPNLHTPQDNPYEEVILLADIVGKSRTTLAEVVKDVLEVIANPLIAGGFAVAHHGFLRATVDVDIIAVGSTKKYINEFRSRGYKFENIQLPIGTLELLTKANKGIDFIYLNNSELLKSMDARSVSGDLYGVPIRYVSIEDLIILK